MLWNEKYKYNPKKREEKPIKNNIKPQNHDLIIQSRQNNNIIVPSKVEKSNIQNEQILKNNNNYNSYDILFDHGFNNDFLKSFYDVNNIDIIAKNSDINHEKWTKYDKNSNSVIHYESISISSRKNK